MGKLSYTNGPIECWLTDDNLIYIVDGYHRLVEGILKGQTQFDIVLVGEGYSDYWRLAPINECVDFNNTSKFKGLENLCSEKLLNDIVKKL